MKLTIGMATYDDYDGVYFTVQALRMYHREILPNIELIVVDNNPTSKASAHIKNLLEGWVKDCAGVKYIPMASPVGTTQSRNRVFSEATGDAVLCMDSHVLIVPGALAKLFAYYAATPITRDLLGGPMLYDDLTIGNTHFDDFWRAEMWGIWGKAWSTPSGVHFTVINTNNQCDYRLLQMGLGPVDTYVTGLPKLAYAGHERHLMQAGCILLSEQDKPFAIPGQGLGLFTCRKDAWLGFNPHFRGFGGEEMYIHEKYRQAGAQALCLPFLKWGHRFGRPNGIPYSRILTRWNKVRNYVLGLQELGLPLDRCYQHFVGGKLLPQWEWDSLVEDAVGREAGPIPPAGFIPPKETPAGSQLPQPRATIATEGELLAWCKTIPRDLDKHLDKIAEYAAKCDHVTELTHRRESTVGLLAAKKVKSYQAETDILIERLKDIFPDKLDVTYFGLSSPLPDIEPTDLLFLDTLGTGERFHEELKAYFQKVRRFIILHDTQIYGEKGPDGKPGLLPVLRGFMKAHPEWSVLYHTQEEYGLTVFGCKAEDKEPFPSVFKMAANFAQATAAYVADKATNVTKEQYDERLGICSICEHRHDNRCALCGCGLAAKAAGRAFECPIGKWPTIQAS